MHRCTSISIFGVDINLEGFITQETLDRERASLKLGRTMQHIQSIARLLHWRCTQIFNYHVNNSMVSFQYSEVQGHITSIRFLIFNELYFSDFVILEFVHQVLNDKFRIVKSRSLENVPILVDSQICKLLIRIVTDGEIAVVVIFNGLE
jgi:hypothetical protein